MSCPRSGSRSYARCGQARRSTHAGKRFETEQLELLPRATRAGGPPVYFGGESEPARALAAAAADVFFINGRPFDDVVAVIEDLRRRPRGLDEPLRFALSGFVIAREDEEEAERSSAACSSSPPATTARV